MTNRPDLLLVNSAIPELKKDYTPETPIGLAVKAASSFLNQRWNKEKHALYIYPRDLTPEVSTPSMSKDDVVNETTTRIAGLLNAYEVANITRPTPENETQSYMEDALRALGKVVATGHNSTSMEDRERASIIQNALGIEIGTDRSNQLILESQINLALNHESKSTLRDLQNNTLEIVVNDAVLENGGLVVEEDKSTGAVLHRTQDVRDLLKKSMGETAYTRLENSGLIKNKEALTLALKQAINHQIEKRGIGSVEDKKASILEDAFKSAYLLPFASIFSLSCLGYGMAMLGGNPESAIDQFGALFHGFIGISSGTTVAVIYSLTGGKKLVDSFREYNSLSSEFDT